MLADTFLVVLCFGLGVRTLLHRRHTLLARLHTLCALLAALHGNSWHCFWHCLSLGCCDFWHICLFPEICPSPEILIHCVSVLIGRPRIAYISHLVHNTR